jgi:hypothetical protein
MKMKITLFFGLVLSVLACDSATDDVHPILEVEFETGPNLPFIINPDQLIGNTASEVAFSDLPNRGMTSGLVQGSFLKYIPDADFTGGEDKFDITLKDADGVARKVGVTVKVTDNSCNYGPAFDNVRVKTGESDRINLLANDFFCGGLPVPNDALGNNGAVGIYLVSSDYGNTNFNDYLSISLDLANDKVEMTLNAPSTPDIIRIIYEVGMVIKPAYLKNFPVSFDYLKEEGGLIPQAFEYYMVSEATIEFFD